MSIPNDPRTPEPAARPGAGRATWPYLLIGAGVLLLLTNLGWFDLGAIWSLLSLWPIALIAVGVDIITSGRYRVPVIVVALIVAAVWGSTGLRGVGFGGVGVGGAGGRVDVAHALDGARSAEVVLRLGVGEVTVDAAAARGALLSGTIVAGRNETIAQRPSRSGTTARIEITSQQTGPTTMMGGDTRRWNLSLTREVPVDLRVDSGVGRTTLDLRDATLSRLRYAGGVGETVVTLPGSGGYRGEFELGVGATTVRLPQSVEARITVRTGLGRANVAGFDRDGDVYTTPGYASAAANARVDLSVQGGVGAVTIQRVR
jgi:hypothetical protein